MGWSGRGPRRNLARGAKDKEHPHVPQSQLHNRHNSMEACVGAHHLSRKLKALGHDARLMPGEVRRHQYLITVRG